MFDPLALPIMNKLLISVSTRFARLQSGLSSFCFTHLIISAFQLTQKCIYYFQLFSLPSLSPLPLPSSLPSSFPTCDLSCNHLSEFIATPSFPSSTFVDFFVNNPSCFSRVVVVAKKILLLLSFFFLHMWFLFCKAQERRRASSQPPHHYSK